MRKPPRPQPKSSAINSDGHSPAAGPIWLHIDEGENVAPLRDVMSLIQAAEPGVGARFTTSDPATATEFGLETLAENRVLEFARENSPSICLWAAGTHDRNLFIAANGLGMPIVLLQLQSQAVEGRSWFRRRRLSMRQLAGVAFAQPADSRAAIALLELGFPAEKIAPPGPLLQTGPGLPVDSRERETLGQSAAGRPIWIAANLPMAELDAVTKAHELALRRSHRAMLILDPADPSDAAEIAKHFTAKGYEIAQRSVEGEPEDRTQVFITDGQDELGLWYGLSVACYLGGTFIGAPSLDPFGPASMGCAILHGPRRTHFAAGFARLIAGQATCELAGPEELGPQIADHFAPDRAALLAHRGWQIISEGAEQQERIAGVIARLIGVDMSE